MRSKKRQHSAGDVQASVLTQCSATNKKAKANSKLVDLQSSVSATGRSDDSSTSTSTTSTTDGSGNCSSYCSCTCTKVVEALVSELEQAKLELSQLRDTVRQLSTTLGLSKQTVQHSASTKSTSSSTSTSSASHRSTSVHQSAVDTAGCVKSFATAVATDPPTAKNFQRSIVSAVHADLQMKQKRSNNIVISGLKTTGCDDEKMIVAGMIWNEFGKEVSVKSCRRLGKKIANRTQNLLVILSTADDATFLIRSARALRQSDNEYVRSNIYINADLTPAEAQAAYEARCVRRQRRAEMLTKKAAQSDSGSWQSMEASQSTFQQEYDLAAAAASVSTTAMTTTTTASNELDPTTPSFTPHILVTAEVHNPAE